MPYPSPTLYPSTGVFPGVAVPGEPPPPPPPPPPLPVERRPTWAERVYAALRPVAYADAALGYPLRTFIGALGAMHQGLDDLIYDDDAGPGWSPLYDVERCPAPLLPWLGQHVGVQLPAGIPEDEARARIRTPSGFARGTRAAMIAAGKRHTTGTKTVVILERDEGPYKLTVVTRASETPDPAAVERDIRAEKPVGLILNYVVASGPIINELADTVDAQPNTIDDYLTA